MAHHRRNRLDDFNRLVTTMDKRQRHRLQAELREKSAELLADIEQRRAHVEQYGEIEWPSRQEEPRVETSSATAASISRNVRCRARAPWDRWLQAAIGGLREEVQDAVSIGFAERDALIDSLQAEDTSTAC